jgi:hypothetical protein
MIPVGLRDRDYMKKKPGDEDWHRYEKETFEAEYGDAGSKRSAGLRKVVIVFVVVILLVIAVSALVSIK